MELSTFILLLSCLIVCNGLELRLNRQQSELGERRNICGILVCEEDTSTPISSLGSDQGESISVLNTIKSLSVFKIGPSDFNNAVKQRGSLLGSMTLQSPTLLRVANGRKLDGTLKPSRAILKIELAKHADCVGEFSCEVRGNDSQGREVVSTTRLVQGPIVQREDPVNSRSLAPVVSLQLMSAIQQLAQSMNGLENRLEDKVASLENRIEDKLLSLQKSIGYPQKQSKPSSEIERFEHRLLEKLDRLEEKIKTELHHHFLNKSLQSETQVLTEVDLVCRQAKEDIADKFNTFQQSIAELLTETLKNVSERLEKTIDNASTVLNSLVDEFDTYTRCGEAAMLNSRNETKCIDLLEKLTSGEASVQCESSNKTDPQIVYRQTVRCIRDMGKTLNESYPQYLTMTQFNLGQEILCDTKTDGGGWTVILSRTKGDVYFHRDWESYKNGFGKPEADEDFWLGNEAVHKLTYVRPHELRVEITSEGKEYVQEYKTFKLENEANKYTLRLGQTTGSIDDGTGDHGLSYSNNVAFSTFDRDNDASSGNCALISKSGWWYKSCYISRLTGTWVNGQLESAWHNGKKRMSVTRAQMKIRWL